MPTNFSAISTKGFKYAGITLVKLNQIILLRHFSAVLIATTHLKKIFIESKTTMISQLFESLRSKIQVHFFTATTIINRLLFYQGLFKKKREEKR